MLNILIQQLFKAFEKMATDTSENKNHAGLLGLDVKCIFHKINWIKQIKFQLHHFVPFILSLTIMINIYASEKNCSVSSNIPIKIFIENIRTWICKHWWFLIISVSRVCGLKSRLCYFLCELSVSFFTGKI